MTPPEMDEDDSAPIYEGSGLLAWVIIPLMLVLCGIFAWVIVTIDTKDEQRIDAERRYEQIKDQPVPTVTQVIETPGPVRTKVVTTPGPTKTIYIERSSDRASRSNAKRTPNRTRISSSGPLTAWKQRYWDEGQEWATWPKTRAVIDCESSNRPTAVSGIYRGLYQIDPGKWASYGGLELAPRPDLATRAEQNYVAYRIYVGNGWTPWSCA